MKFAVNLRLHYEVNRPSLDINHLFYRLAAQGAAHGLVLQRQGHNRLLRGIRLGHDHAPQAAVDLHRHLQRLGAQQLGVEGRPGGGVHAAAPAQFGPAFFGQEGGKRRQHLHQLAQPGSPIVWGGRVFVTTAISSAGEATFKHGLFGEGDASPDRSVHQFKVLAIDARDGHIVWDSTAYDGVPKQKRHVKNTYASSTPATDGKRVVAFFGSNGIYCFDMAGRLLWKRDFGFLDVGAYDAPEYEWGTASSPIIYKNRVIVQCDTQKADFLYALDIDDGHTVWRAERDELPSWGTPSVLSTELIWRVLVI